jgi:hypothetical protein
MGRSEIKTYFLSGNVKKRSLGRLMYRSVAVSEWTLKKLTVMDRQVFLEQGRTKGS